MKFIAFDQKRLYKTEQLEIMQRQSKLQSSQSVNEKDY